MEANRMEILDEGAKRNREALHGTTAEPKAAAHHDLDGLIGSWTQEEAATFKAAITPFKGIDPALWG